MNSFSKQLNIETWHRFYWRHLRATLASSLDAFLWFGYALANTDNKNLHWDSYMLIETHGALCRHHWIVLENAVLKEFTHQSICRFFLQSMHFDNCVKFHLHKTHSKLSREKIQNKNATLEMKINFLFVFCES